METNKIITMESVDILTNVKQVIRAIIVSTTEQMTVKRLMQDYIKTEGTPIPFAELGFDSIERFLSAIPDAVLLIGSGPNPQVRVKSNEKTTHIENLVKYQKHPQNSRYQSNRGSYPVWANEDSYWRNYFKYNRINVNSSNSTWRQAEGESMTGFESNQNLYLESEDKFNSFVPASEGATCPYVVNEILGQGSQNTFKGLVSAWEGETYPHEVNTNVALGSENNVETYPNNEQINENWKENVLSPASSDKDNVPHRKHEQPMDVEYPIDATSFDMELPKRNFHNRFKLNNCIQVQIVTVTSPSSFNFWIYDKGFNTYKTMYENIRQFYNNQSVHYTIPQNQIQVGHLCAVQFNDVWQRARVLSIRAGCRKDIEVDLIDVANRTWISHSDVKYLHHDFSTLQEQCWSGGLAFIAPRQGANYSADEIDNFYKLVCYRRLFAKIKHINTADNTVSIVLVDPDAASPTKNINQMLIDSGRIRRCQLPHI